MLSISYRNVDQNEELINNHLKKERQIKEQGNQQIMEVNTPSIAMEGLWIMADKDG